MNPKYFLKILGCAANEADGQRLRAVLASLGFQPTARSADAQLIILLACSVRQNAMDFIYRQSAQWHKRRKAGQLKTILSGCVLAEDKEKLAPYFDWITEITTLPSWPEKLAEWFASEINCAPSATITSVSAPTAPTTVLGTPSRAKTSTPALTTPVSAPSPQGYPDREAHRDAATPLCDYLDLPADQDSPYAALVPIMNGCNNFCAYCAVPYTRGREVSRPLARIVTEVEQLLTQGYREITLLGQNVNSYHCPETDADFPALLRRLQALPGDFWLRFMTSHPKDLSPDLLTAISECDKVCEHLHLAVQSGSDQILQAMNRHYTRAHFEKLATNFRTTIKKSRVGARQFCAVTTDVIVGFPGETADDFEQTADLFRALKFDLAYIAQYSPRPGTAAAKLPDDVPAAEKKRRADILNQILKQTAAANNQKYLGQTLECLVIKKHAHNQLLARTRTAKNVLIPTAAGLLGKIVAIKITQADAWGLWGEINDK